jgi:hypothetical protein
MFKFATSLQVGAVMDLVGKGIRWALSSSHPKDILQLIEYLLDFPEVHHGSVVCLTDRAVC